MHRSVGHKAESTDGLSHIAAFSSRKRPRSLITPSPSTTDPADVKFLPARRRDTWGLRRRAAETITPHEAARAIRMIELERESIERGGAKRTFER